MSAKLENPVVNSLSCGNGKKSHVENSSNKSRRTENQKPTNISFFSTRTSYRIQNTSNQVDNTNNHKNRRNRELNKQGDAINRGRPQNKISRSTVNKYVISTQANNHQLTSQL